MTLKLVCAGALALAIAGCATQSPQSAFEDVRTLSDSRIHWRDDSQAKPEIAAMLGQSLSMDSAVHVALLNNPALQADFETLAISRAELVQAGLLRNPMLDVSARFPDRSPRATDIEFSLTQNLFDLLTIPSRRRVADSELRATKLRVAQRVSELSAEVRSAFVELAAAQQMDQLRRQSMLAAQLAVETAQRLHDAGNLSELDLRADQAAFEQAASELDLAESTLAALRERLSNLMGSPQVDWKIQEQIPVTETAPRDVEALAKSAIEKRLDARSARESIESQAKTLGVQKQTPWFADAAVGVSGERDTDRQWKVGPTISVPIPLFDTGQASTERAEAQLRQAKQSYLALVAQIRSDVRTSCAQMTSSQQRVARMGRVVSLRTQIVEESQKQYNGMLLSPFDLLKRKQDLLEAQRQAIEAARDAALANIALERATGGAK